MEITKNDFVYFVIFSNLKFRGEIKIALKNYLAPLNNSSL